MASLTAQSTSDAPVSELQRKFHGWSKGPWSFQRLSEMSGTEPIQLIERNESLEPVELETDAQLSYDELPGPAVEPSLCPKRNRNLSRPQFINPKYPVLLLQPNSVKGIII